MSVVHCCGSYHQSMGMESSDGDGGRSVAKKSRIGLKVGYRLAVVNVEDLDTMSLGAADEC